MNKIGIGDLVEVLGDYQWNISLHLVVDISDTCYFIMYGDTPVRSVSKKKCRLHRLILNKKL